MHIFSVLDKLLQVVPTPIIASNNDSEQIKKTQDENKQKLPTKDKSYNGGNNRSSTKPSFQNDSGKSGKTKSDPNKCYVCFPKDGDTFVGLHNNEKKTFRLAGIDTPEYKSDWAKEATAFLKEKIGKKFVHLTFLGKDSYNREIVEVYLDAEKTQHVNKMLLDAGLAQSERYTNSDGDNTHDILEHANNEIAEVVAKVKGKGMWGGQPPDDLDILENINLPTEKKRFPR